MKTIFKYSCSIFFTGVLAVLLAGDAQAQRGAFHGGGAVGGASRIGGSSGFAFGGGYHGYGLGYHGYGGFGNYGFYRPGFGYFGYPYLGFYVGALPYGYYPFYYGADPYYYADGVFYTPYANGGYQVAAPPVGAAVPSLPRGAKAIMIDNVQYYEFNGIYYKTVINDKGEKVFVVAGKDGVLNTDGAAVNTEEMGPRVGDVVDRLPDNCHRVTLNGKKYFVAPNDIYFEQFTDNNGNVAYRIASIPEEPNAPQAQPNNNNQMPQGYQGQQIQQ